MKSRTARLTPEQDAFVRQANRRLYGIEIPEKNLNRPLRIWKGLAIVQAVILALVIYEACWGERITVVEHDNDPRIESWSWWGASTKQEPLVWRGKWLLKNRHGEWEPFFRPPEAQAPPY